MPSKSARRCSRKGVKPEMRECPQLQSTRSVLSRQMPAGVAETGEASRKDEVSPPRDDFLPLSRPRHFCVFGALLWLQVNLLHETTRGSDLVTVVHDGPANCEQLIYKISAPAADDGYPVNTASESGTQGGAPTDPTVRRGPATSIHNMTTGMTRDVLPLPVGKDLHDYLSRSNPAPSMSQRRRARRAGVGHTGHIGTQRFVWNEVHTFRGAIPDLGMSTFVLGAFDGAVSACSEEF